MITSKYIIDVFHKVEVDSYNFLMSHHLSKLIISFKSYRWLKMRDFPYKSYRRNIRFYMRNFKSIVLKILAMKHFHSLTIFFYLTSTSKNGNSFWVTLKVDNKFDFDPVHSRENAYKNTCASYCCSLESFMNIGKSLKQKRII